MSGCISGAGFTGRSVSWANADAAESEYGQSLDWFFRQWLAPYPQVDYRFQLLKSERTASGFRHSIRLYKRGPNPPIEPVELRVTEWNGVTHTIHWDGRGPDNVFAVETRRAILAVSLDPRGRLRQRMAGENVDHRLDDNSPAPVKLIYNNFGALINFQTLSLDLSLDFTLSRVFDLKDSVRFLVYRNEAAQIGGLTSYTHHFGRMITPARLEPCSTRYRQ